MNCGEDTMALINENFLKLPANYLFAEIDRRVRLFQAKNPKAEIIIMARGDMSQPLAPAVVAAMQQAVAEMAEHKTFRGYGPPQGYDFLANAIIENDFESRGIKLDRDELFISDGAKSDIANIQEIFGTDNLVAVPDPVFPLYVDTNVMAGRTGLAKANGEYDRILYMPCLAENEFIPQIPQQKIDLIYLCFPNNPTGAVATKEVLQQWVDYAAAHRAIIFFDAAYEAYIRDPQIPHSIYEIDGARETAIEFRSFSKTAGFTGLRCAFTIVPKQLQAFQKDGRVVPVNPIWNRRHSTKFGGISYITQAGAAAVYTSEGKTQVRDTIDFYLANAAAMREALTRLGHTVHGGVHAPFLWMKTPANLSSWEYFDQLLKQAHVVATPGAGFGAGGEGYVRLSAFATPENIEEAMVRLAAIE